MRGVDEQASHSNRSARRKDSKGLLDKMERIVFIGDPFRVTVGFPRRIANVTWLHNFPASTIGRFTDPEISITYPLSGR